VATTGSASASQRDHRRTFACADQALDVVAHAREGIAAALPRLILVAFNAPAAIRWIVWQYLIGQERLKKGAPKRKRRGRK